MESCPNCGRTFLPERIAIHLKSCRPDNPHKSVTSNPKAVPNFRKSINVEELNNKT